MSKHMPPKLDLKSAGWLTRHSIAYDICQRSFDAWYDTHIRPLFENAVEVYGQWSGVYRHFGESYSDKNELGNTHKALLIRIEPIEEESDSFLEELDLVLNEYVPYNQAKPLIEKAKAYLAKLDANKKGEK